MSLEPEYCPKISIIIPVFNGANYLRQAIESALNQDYRNSEILVVNDGSKDGGATRDIAHSFGDRIRLLEKENGGVATALNLGIAEMKGEFFSWLSHDDLYEPNKISAQVEALRAVPFEERERTLVYSEWKTVDKDGYPIGQVQFSKQFPLHKLNLPLFPLVKGLMHGCALLVPRSRLLAVGGFDVLLKTTQDYDCWLKILKESRILFCPGLLVRSRVHADQDSKRIGTHSLESDHLWLKIFQSLSSSQMCAFEGSEKRFLQSASEFCERNGFLTAMEFIAHRLSEKESPADADVLFFKPGAVPDYIRSLAAIRESSRSPKSVFFMDVSAETLSVLRDQFPTLNLVAWGDTENSDYLFLCAPGSVFFERKMEIQLQVASAAGLAWCGSKVLKVASDRSFQVSKHEEIAMESVMISCEALGKGGVSLRAFEKAIALNSGFILDRILSSVPVGGSVRRPVVKRTFMRRLLSWGYKRSGLIFLREWAGQTLLSR